jgi:hypothetical protein
LTGASIFTSAIFGKNSALRQTARKESGAYAELVICMPGRCDFALRRVAGRQHNFDFETDRIDVRCDDCATVLAECLKSNCKS